MKKGWLGFCAIVLMGLSVGLIYGIKEQNYSLVAKAIEVSVAYILLIVGILARNRKLKDFNHIFLKEAFAQDRKSRRELMTAIDTFFDEKYGKTLKKLDKLRKKCISYRDEIAIQMFIGMCYHAEKKYIDAIEIYERIIATYDQNAYVWALLGCAYDECRNDKVYEANTQAMQIDNKNAFVYSCLAYCSMRRKDIKSAAEFASKAIKLDKQRFDACAILALIAAFQGMKKPAKKLQKAYYGTRTQKRELRKWTNDILKNKDINKFFNVYCSNIRQFHQPFRL